MALEEFVAAATASGSRVICAASEAEAVAAVQAACAGKACLVEPLPLLAGVEVGLPCDDPWLADVGVTQAWAAVSETGTVAIVQQPGFARQTAILPLVCVVLVDSRRLLDSYADLVGEIAALDPRPSGVQLVTGPSRSGDVQGIIVRGMHGPAEVVLVVS